jgi:hypothetical protein
MGQAWQRLRFHSHGGTFDFWNLLSPFALSGHFVKYMHIYFIYISPRDPHTLHAPNRPAPSDLVLASCPLILLQTGDLVLRLSVSVHLTCLHFYVPSICTDVSSFSCLLNLQEIWCYAFLFLYKEVKVRKIKDDVELQKSERRKVGQPTSQSHQRSGDTINPVTSCNHKASDP